MATDFSSIGKSFRKITDAISDLARRVRHLETLSFVSSDSLIPYVPSLSYDFNGYEAAYIATTGRASRAGDMAITYHSINGWELFIRENVTGTEYWFSIIIDDSVVRP